MRRRTLLAISALLCACSDLASTTDVVVLAPGVQLTLELSDGAGCDSQPDRACLSSLVHDEVKRVRLRPKSGAVTLGNYARTPTEAIFEGEFSPANTSPSGLGIDVQYFVGSRLRPRFRYIDQEGAPLPGVGPILMSTDDPAAGAKVDGADLWTGVGANRISLSSPTGALQTHTVTVADADSITGVGGLDDEELFVNLTACANIHAIGHSDTRIHGQSPVRPQLRLMGEGVTVSLPPLGTELGELCMRGHAPGSVAVELSWGAAVEERTWTVQ